MRAGPDEPKVLRPCPALQEMQEMMIDLKARRQKQILTTRSRAVTEVVREHAARQQELRHQTRLKHNPHNPASAVLLDGAWHDETCFLIAGGPSLHGFDFERLRGRGRVIAINRAMEFVPWADVAFFMDNKFYKRMHEPRYRAAWDGFEGKRVFLDLIGRPYDDCYHVRSLGRAGLSSSVASGLYHGNNSGVGALNLALCMKASPIYLLGYDCRHMNGRAHFHDGYGPRSNENVVRGFARDFERQARFVRRLNARIVNLNPASLLRAYPFSTIDEVLKDGQTRQGVGDNDDVVLAPELQPASA